MLSTGDSITPEDLPLEKMRGTPMSMERVSEAAPRPAQSFAAASLDEQSRLDYERIVESLSLCSGNQTRAAKLLGCPAAPSAPASRPTTSPGPA